MGFLIIKNFFALKNTLYIKKMEEKRSDNKRKYKELKYRHRAYKSRKKLLKEIEDHPVIGKIVKDYKNLIFSKVIKSMMTPAEVTMFFHHGSSTVHCQQKQTLNYIRIQPSRAD
jgi:hypothetical protein